MKNNQGITIITLAITIIVIILIASITIYNGMDTVDSFRKKSATDATNAIYQAILANESILPSDNHAGRMVSELDTTMGESLSDTDFILLGLDYTNEDCTVVFDKVWSAEDNKITYTFTYTNDLGKTYDDIQYYHYKEIPKTSTTAEFDSERKVNRPVIDVVGMQAIYQDGLPVEDVYTDNWYNYEKGISRFATMQYNGKKYVWIPRFAYRIQDFYVGKVYNNVPNTAIDIVFLRDSGNYMANGETLSFDYTIHPAFENGETGFWMMIEASGKASSIGNAISNAAIADPSGQNIGHLMKNSEYAAALFLSRWLENQEIKWGDTEYVAAILDETRDNFDLYSTNQLDVNYYRSVKGQALVDTPWNLKNDLEVPGESKNYFVRSVTYGGEFYFEVVGDPIATTKAGDTSAAYRSVITK